MLVPWRVQFQLYPNYKRKHPTSVKRSHVRAGCALFGRNGGTGISGAYLFEVPTWDPLEFTDFHPSFIGWED